MSLSPEDSERLKKAALAAVALLVGREVVKYVREQGMTKGYVYRIEKGRALLMGLLGEKGELPTQISGELKFTNGEPSDFTPDKDDISPYSIDEFVRLFDAESDVRE